MDALLPFEGYSLSVYLHSGQGRRKARLTKQGETTIHTSYARYLMCVHLGYRLGEDKHVDHIDGNPLNDSLSNLQVLTRRTHGIKTALETRAPAIYLDFVCPVCGVSFKLARRVADSRAKVYGNTARCCSNRCRAIRQHTHKPADSEVLVSRVCLLRGAGYSVADVSSICNISVSTVKRYLRR